MNTSTAFPAVAEDAKPLLRLLTCGSVDDGKSTLIGRLLYDTGRVYDDQLAAIEKNNKRVNGKPDLSLLVDGLQAEREQGITIDVAYRYFNTPKRKFIIADTPGHEQYTRNMVTGASTADLGVILIDARQGVLPQTRRHSIVLSLLGIKQVVAVVNKMDLVDFSEETFDSIKEEYLAFADKLGFSLNHVIPVSALDGDNVVHGSDKMDWYKGDTLLHILEEAENFEGFEDKHFRLPVQYVIRPNLDYRGYAGTINSGQLSVGDTVKVLPSGHKADVKAIQRGFDEVQKAGAGEAVVISLTKELDISRGDVIVKAEEEHAPIVSKTFRADLVWMDTEEYDADKEYFFRFQTKTITGKIKKVDKEIDIHTYDRVDIDGLELNQIAEVEIELADRYALDMYSEHRFGGSFVLIDRISNQTAAAGMIRKVHELKATPKLSKEERLAIFENEFKALVRKHLPEWDESALAHFTDAFRNYDKNS